MHALSNLLMVQADPISKRYVGVKQYLASAEGSADRLYMCTCMYEYTVKISRCFQQTFCCVLKDARLTTGGAAVG